jgi:hypothetical protein
MDRELEERVRLAREHAVSAAAGAAAAWAEVAWTARRGADLRQGLRDTAAASAALRDRTAEQRAARHRSAIARRDPGG